VKIRSDSILYIIKVYHNTNLIDICFVRPFIYIYIYIYIYMYVFYFFTF